jgi:hypothetical protein
MIEYFDDKSRRILDYVDKLVPVTADAEINYALKRYYLANEYDEEEVERIILKREQDLKMLMEQMILTSFDQLNEPVEETKSMDMIKEDGDKTSDDAIIQGYENNQPFNGKDGVDTTERGYEEQCGL